MAEALIPMPNSQSDPFWISAARTVFANAAYQCAERHEPSLSQLLHLLLSSELSHLHHVLKGTSAESLVSEKIEKTALSIRAVLVNALSSLMYLEEQGEPFSIRQWIRDEAQDSWLFVTSLAHKHATLKPLISLWLDIASNALGIVPYL